MQQNKIQKERVLFLEKGKRGIFEIIFGRTTIIIIMLLTQVLFLISIMIWLNGAMIYVWGGSIILSAIPVLNIINNESNPVIKLTWIVLIMALPVFGLLLYAFINMEFGHRFMMRKYSEINAKIENYAHPENAVLPKNIVGNDEFKNLVYYLKSEGFSAYKNTAIKYFPLGEDKLTEMLVRLEAAKKFIFIEYFIIEEGYMWGRILDILERKVKEGVEVRVMYDGTCAINKLPYNYPKKLKHIGIKCKMFAPIRPFISTHYNNRDHRKIMVIDGKFAFTGGINLADEYISQKTVNGHWKDTAVMLEGDAVRSFTLMFLQMWNIVDNEDDYDKYINEISPVSSKGYVIPYGDSPFDHALVGEMVYLDMINTAKKYIHITTPYLIPDNEMITALSFAARRGVDVVLLMPHIPDNKVIFALGHTYYKQLINNGVKIYEYTPGFIHAKMFVSDDKKAIVGSINLDYRSLYHHFECAAYMYDSPAVAEVENDIMKTLEKSTLITPNDLKNDSFIRKTIGKLLRLFAPLL